MDHKLLREWVRLLINEMGSSNRKSRAGDWSLAVDKLSSYLEKLGYSFEVTSAAKSGSTAADVTGVLKDEGGNVIPSSAGDEWHLEVKSFGRDDLFKIEMTNPSSSVRKAVLSTDASLGTKEDIEQQIRKKLSSNQELIMWIEDSLKSPNARKWEGSLVIPGSKDERGIYIISADQDNFEENDWDRVRAVGGSGKPRPIYTVPNALVRAAEKEAYYTDEVEEAIQEDFASKGDQILLLCGPGCSSVRCFSLVPEAEAVFMFPQFASGGETIKVGSSYGGSFGGGGRIGLTININDFAGVKI